MVLGKDITTSMPNVKQAPLTPTIHSIPRETLAPLIPADELISIDVTPLQEAPRAPFRSHHLCNYLLHISILPLLQITIIILVDVPELPRDDDSIGIVAWFRGVPVVLPSPFCVQQLD